MAAHRTPASAAIGEGPWRPRERPEPPAVPVSVGWTVAGLVLGATALVLSFLLPSPLVLLATGCALAAAGFGTAAALFLSGRRMGRDGTAGWDAASALLFLGLAAVLLADLPEAMAVLTGSEPR